MITVHINDENLISLLQSVREMVREELAAAKRIEIEDKFYSPAETCKFFKPSISKVTLWKWTQVGRIPMQRIGGRVYYKYSDIVKAVGKTK